MSIQSFDAEGVLRAIRALRLDKLAARPRVLFGAEEVASLRASARARDGMIDALDAQAQALLKNDANDPNPLQAYIGGGEALNMAYAFFLTEKDAYAVWAKQRIAALFKLETWRAPVHGTMVCDHCMGNIGAYVSLSYDLLSTHYSSAEADELSDGLRTKLLLPFLEATAGNEPIWWFRKDVESNWKIMTCGDSGTAFCGFAERWPEAGEALARAAQGVIQTLDAVPAEGDWPEGFNYWFATLQMGLRFARALRRLSGGTIDLFQHPALRITGDFGIQLLATGGLERGGRIYNFNDNTPTPDDRAIEAIAMLACEHRRGDWMALARKFPVRSALFLACDQPTIASTLPTEKIGYFPRTGIATLRSGWRADDTFVGFKSGPSAVGHSHLDANSFLIESRGQRLSVDYPYWPQAHFLGFFDTAKLRWNFDANATIGHSTLLVDGQGQTHGSRHPGLMRKPRLLAGGAMLAVGDASLAYPGLLRKFVRSILLLSADAMVIRDVVECDGERHVEWLLQHAGTATSRGNTSVIESPGGSGVTMSVTPLLPDRSKGWRTSDVARTSAYVNSDTLKEVEHTIRYRSFSAFQKAAAFEFLFAIRIGDRDAETGWVFQGEAGAWSLRSHDSATIIRPDGDAMSLE